MLESRLTNLSIRPDSQTLRPLAFPDNTRGMMLSAQKLDCGYDAAYQFNSEAVRVSTDSPITNTCSYDANGNPSSDSGQAPTNIISGTTTNRLLWSARNQLTNMLGAVTATFAYDGLGRRVARTVSAVQEKYLYDGLDIISQLDGSGNVRGKYFRGLAIDEPWMRTDITPLQGQKTETTNRTYLADALGSIVALTDTNKIIQTEYDYEPFGATTTTGAGNKNSYKFTAREDDGTGLYFYRARYYHPVLGRFVSEDPLEMIDGPGMYAYVGNDPIDYIDPLGWTWKSNWEFFWDFVTGGGDQSRTYGPGDVQMQEMQNSPGAQKLRDEFIRSGCTGVRRFTYGTGRAFWETAARPWRWGETATQVGGFAGATAVRNSDGTVTYRIPNYAGTKSFFYHIVPNRKGTTGPMRTIEQVFEWTEPLPGNCQCPQ